MKRSKRYKNKLNSLDSLLPNVAKGMGIDSRMKELMLMNYWPDIVKGKIAKDTKPYSVTRTKKGLVLNVGAKSSMAVQEINMVKMVVLDKLNNLASQIGLRVADIHVSPKFWEPEEKQSAETFKKEADKEALNYSLQDIELTEDQKKEIEKTLANSEADNEILERIRGVLERDMKLKNYKQQMGNPVCESCGVVLHNKNDIFCPACRF